MQELVDRHVEMVTEILSTRASSKDSESVSRGIEFLWRIAAESREQVGRSIVNRTQMGFSDILKEQSMEVKLHYADKLAECIKSNSMGFLAVKMLARLLKVGFDSKSDHGEIKSL